jgi:HPt (histidine-containing phosphotransfer) domain-containing protein
MGEDELIKSMLVKFIAHTEEQIGQSIPRALRAGDRESAMREAHSIRGAAYSMSGKELGAAAIRLEKAFKDADSAEIEAALAPVEEAFCRFKAAAKDYLEGKVPNDL